MTRYLDEGVSRSQVLRTDEVRHQGSTRRVEEVLERRIEEDDGVEVLHNEGARKDNDREGDEGQPAYGVDDDDREPPVEAVDEDATEQAEQEHRQELEEVGNAQLQRRAG